MSHNIYTIQPVILCGGSGTRLWPMSTPKNPKQLISLGDKGTLLEETLRRVSIIMDKCGYKTRQPMLVMNKDHKLPQKLAESNLPVVLEEYANDTAVAVMKACLKIKDNTSDDKIIMVVLPADHYIHNVDSFVDDIVSGISHITDDNIVLYGLDPTSPETKYGYIIPSDNGVNFREKPDVDTAISLIEQNALWNSGIFAASVDLVLKCLYDSPHNIYNWISNPCATKAPSFDVAVLQEHPDIYAHHCSGWNWSDVGTWESFTQIPEIQDEINSSSCIRTANCNNIDILNRGSGHIVIIGCENLRVVVNGSDILIMPNTGDHNNHLKEIATKINS